MATKLNKEALEFAKTLIQAGKIVNTEENWHKHLPSTGQENQFIENNGIEEYARWHLGIDTEEDKANKGRYKFPYGDFNAIFRSGLTAAKQRAAQNDYADIEKAADQLLQLLQQAEEKSQATQ